MLNQIQSDLNLRYDFTNHVGSKAPEKKRTQNGGFACQKYSFEVLKKKKSDTPRSWKTKHRNLRILLWESDSGENVKAEAESLRKRFLTPELSCCVWWKQCWKVPPQQKLNQSLSWKIGSPKIRVSKIHRRKFCEEKRDEKLVWCNNWRWWKKLSTKHLMNSNHKHGVSARPYGWVWKD